MHSKNVRATPCDYCTHCNTSFFHFSFFIFSLLSSPSNSSYAKQLIQAFNPNLTSTYVIYSMLQDGIFLAKTLLKLKNEHSVKRSNYLTSFSARLRDGILKHFILLLDKVISAILAFLNDADAGEIRKYGIKLLCYFLFLVFSKRAIYLVI